MRSFVLLVMQFTFLSLHAQDVDELCNIPVDGRFWGIKGVSGEIWEYTISGGSVQTGVMITDGPDQMWSLAYCNAGGPASFYTDNGFDGYRYYENNTWVNVSLGVDLFKCGGQGSHFYFTEQAHTERLYHCTGNTATLIADVQPGRFRGDIVVNDDGNALVAYSANELSFDVNEYRMYSPTGELLQAYTVEYDYQGGYGAFLLGDVLYLGFVQTSGRFSNVLVPLTFAGDVATFGTPIPFITTGETDLASCGTSTVGIAELSSRLNVLVARPNPANEQLLVEWPTSLRGDPVDFRVFDARAAVVNVPHSTHGDQLRLDVSGIPIGCYQMRLLDAQGGLHTARFVRQ